MKKIILVLLCLATIFITGCVSQEPELPLAGKTYKFKNAKGLSATITFNKDKTINGFSGVNRFFGEFRAAGDRIIFARMGSTKMAGSPEAMKFEDKFIKALSKADRFCEIGRTLTLFSGDMPILTLKTAE
jgi:heat shock protein HslJ